jgi:hypothetical protein
LLIRTRESYKPVIPEVPLILYAKIFPSKIFGSL